MQTLFFISVALTIYVYLGYPFLAFCLGCLLQRSVKKQQSEPSVTVLISAYNEEKCIASTIENKLNLDYPKDRLEIIVISDGSTDATDTIVSSFASANVRLLRQELRAGKTSALNLAVPLAKGEIIIFSDANSIYSPHAVRQLVANFADETVGYVSGKMIYSNLDGTTIGEGCSAYMRYENFLREIETRLGSMVGVDGGIDAMRKSLFCPMNADQLPDFVQPLRIVEQGYRVVYEPEAVLRESALNKDYEEFKMRVRVSLRAFWALYDMRHMLFFGKNPLFSWQIWSHKLLRYSCFFFLISMFMTNSMLLSSGAWYQLFFLLQITVILIALLEPFLEKAGISWQLFRFWRYFLLLNLAAAFAFGKFLSGSKQVTWTPRTG